MFAGTLVNQNNGGERAARFLLVTNAYPNDMELYRYAFVHARVKAYLAAGLPMEVYCVDRRRTDEARYLFDGVPVMTGPIEAYRRWIASNPHYLKYLVHFPVDYLVEPLREAGGESILWMHGYEIEAWHRRWFSLLADRAVTSQDIARRAAEPQVHREHLRMLLHERPDARCVTVSRWFLDYVIRPDLGIPGLRASVIPNYVDGNRFTFEAKDPELARRVLVVRPFTGPKYAVDQIVRTIIDLQRMSGSTHGITFSVFGDGPYFDDLTAVLRSMRHVTLHKTYLTPDEIAGQHREHGVFLAPTRWDSQGVSTCEAMASGLVPVTTSVSAVPEFVSHNQSGLLSEPEDTRGLADNLVRLVEHPDLFTRLSRRGASSVRESCGYDQTVGREIQLIQGSVSETDAGTDLDWEACFRQLEVELGRLMVEAKRLLEGGGAGGS